MGEDTKDEDESRGWRGYARDIILGSSALGAIRQAYQDFMLFVSEHQEEILEVIYWIFDIARDLSIIGSLLAVLQEKWMKLRGFISAHWMSIMLGLAIFWAVRYFSPKD